jgi:hypothetical protein
MIRIERKKGIEGGKSYPDTLSLQEIVMFLGDMRRVHEDHSLGTTLGNVLVLKLLTVAETEHLIEMSPAFERLGVAVGRSDDSEPTTSDVSESAVEPVEVSSVREEDSEGNLLLVGAIKLFRKEHDTWVHSEGESVSVVVVEICFQGSLDDLQHSLEGVSGLLALKSGEDVNKQREKKREPY